jgi:hypothetical protein
MATRAGLATALAVCLAVAGCASKNSVASRTSGVRPISSPAITQLCVDPHPAVPKPVSPAIPNVRADGTLASTWSLDGGQATVAPAGGVQPRVERQQALCTLLAANDSNGFEVLDDDSGFSLVLGKVTIADQVLATPDPVPASAGMQQPPPPVPFHSRLAWIGVIDPPWMSTCGTIGFASSTPSSALVPYQLLILDADTGADGLVYGARSYSPCTGSPASGPDVAPLVVNMSVPWRLVSRDPGGLFGTIAVSVTTCDNYAIGANTSSSQLGLVELNVWRPIDACGTAKEVDQTVRGPTVSDPLPPTLTHAAVGYRDAAPDDTPNGGATTTALLCEQSLRGNGVVAATFATTVGDLLSVHDGPPPGNYPFAKALVSAVASAPAAWCETKTVSGYTINAVGPDGSPLTGVAFTFSTFQDLSNGPPALP